jgi:hypothetical protein
MARTSLLPATFSAGGHVHRDFHAEAKVDGGRRFPDHVSSFHLRTRRRDADAICILQAITLRRTAMNMKAL